MAAVGLLLLAISFARYFSDGHHDIVSFEQFYQWNTDPEHATKTSALVVLDSDCAWPIIKAAQKRWALAHPNEVVAASPLPPFGSPSFNPEGDRRVIDAEPSNGWWDLGVNNVDAATTESLRPCLRRSPVYSHFMATEMRSDLGRWMSRGILHPRLALGLVAIGILGMAGVIEACVAWFARGEFRMPR